MKKIIIFLTIILLISVIITFVLFNNKPLKIYFFDVEKSDSILITYNDKNILIDTSKEDYSDRVIDYLNKYKVKTIDYLIITHYDKDHVGGASKIIDNFDIKNVYQSSYIKNSEYYNNYVNSLKEKNITPFTISDEYVFEIDDLKFKIYGTNMIYENDTSNNSSLVISLKYKNNSFLFAGDIEEDRIEDLINQNIDSHDLIKMPHHGNYNKKIDNLINKINPKYAIITNNTIDNKTINLLNKKNIKYYLTNEMVIVSSDGNNIIIKH